MHSWSEAGEISVATGFAPAMQAIYTVKCIESDCYSGIYNYDLYPEHCQCYGEFISFIPMVLIM